MQVTAYTTTWCPDCSRSKRVLARLGIEFSEVDVEAVAGADLEMRHLNGGSGRVPTIVVNNEVLVEPADSDLEALLTRTMAHELSGLHAASNPV